LNLQESSKKSSSIHFLEGSEFTSAFDSQLAHLKTLYSAPSSFNHLGLAISIEPMTPKGKQENGMSSDKESGVDGSSSKKPDYSIYEPARKSRDSNKNINNMVFHNEYCRDQMRQKAKLLT